MTTQQVLSAPVLAVDPPRDDLEQLLARQRAAALRDPIPAAAVRLDRMDRLAAAVLEHAEEIVHALSADFGNRPLHFSYQADVLSGIKGLDEIRAELEDWMRDEVVPGSAESGTPTFLQTRPLGVVGIVGPWNFPVSLVVQPALEALAAGNRVMIKMSEIPSRTAEVVARAIAGSFASDEVVVVRGGAATAAAFTDLAFDHLFFTGSPQVGAMVAATAGKNLVPVTLELGGKNPVVVGHDADIQVAAERISASRMMNGGQICLCPDYVFVPAPAVDAFVQAYTDSISRYFPTYLANDALVTLVNESNYARVTGLVDDAVAKGARAVVVTPAGEASTLPDAASRRVAPTLLLGVTEEMAIASEEIFGPVISVYPYEDVDEAISYVNARPHALAAYWYGDDTDDFREFCRRTTSGGLTRNDMALHAMLSGVPFGGVGRSGMGAYHGKAGFDTFSHRRVITSSLLPVGVAPGMMPPFAEGALAAVRGAADVMLEGVRERLRAE